MYSNINTSTSRENLFFEKKFHTFKWKIKFIMILIAMSTCQIISGYNEKQMSYTLEAKTSVGWQITKLAPKWAPVTQPEVVFKPMIQCIRGIHSACRDSTPSLILQHPLWASWGVSSKLFPSSEIVDPISLGTRLGYLHAQWLVAQHATLLGGLMYKVNNLIENKLNRQADDILAYDHAHNNFHDVTKCEYYNQQHRGLE